MTDHPIYRSPKYLMAFFRWFCRPEIVEDIEGDLVEKFNSTARSSNEKKARWNTFWQVIFLLRPGIVKPIFKTKNKVSMRLLRYHLKIGWRILQRNRGFSIINIGGLALGMAVAMSIVLWITDELKYDRFHTSGKQVFKVMRHVYSGDEIQTSDRVTWNIANELKEDYPGVKHVAITSDKKEIVFKHKNNKIREDGFYATPSFFQMFSWQILAGDTSNPLSDPSSIFISESMAQRHFDSDGFELKHLLGQEIQHNIPDLSGLKIAGIFSDPPQQSSLQFDFILPISIYENRNRWLTNWNNSGPHMYVHTDEKADWQQISEDIVDIQNQHIEGFRSDLFLHPYETQHLYASFKNGKVEGGRIQYVRIFGLIALMIILIACINFMNLSTARSAQRSKEIGVRKTIGAGKASLIGQFIAEAIILTLIAFFAALLLVASAIPMLNSIAGKELSIANIDFTTWSIFGAIGLAAALLSASYPALYFSSISLNRLFQRNSSRTLEKSYLRRSLVVFQFVMSFLLIVGTLTIYQQIRFIQQKDLGFDRDHVIVMPLEGPAKESYQAFRTELLKQSGVEKVGAASETPIEIRSNTHQVNWSGKDPSSEISNRILSVDAHFAQALGMKIIQGSSFRDMPPDQTSDSYLINQKATEIMGFDDPIGEQLSFWGGEGPIVGVVKDFHMASFYEDIEPLVLWLRPQNISDLFIRTKPGQLQDAIKGLQDCSRSIQ